MIVDMHYHFLRWPADEQRARTMTAGWLNHTAIAGIKKSISRAAAHMGDMWWHDWAAIAKYKKSIYGDLAMWQLTAEGKPRLFRRYLREILDIVGPEQVLFSSDGPVFEPVVPNRRWVGIMKSLTKRGTDGIRFTEAEVAAMLGDNAARVFNLTR